MTSDKTKLWIHLRDSALNEGRPRYIHAHACQNCPSIHTLDDPESLQIRDFATREEKIESVFRCGWRGDKACRGYADFMGVTEEDLSFMEPEKMPADVPVVQGGCALPRDQGSPVNQSEPECPGEHCPMCNGQACDLCGAGCWGRPAARCDHDVLERHRLLLEPIRKEVCKEVT